jgi:peptidase E
MTKYILAGGYIHKAADGGKDFCEEIIKGIASKPVKILDCLFARTEDSWVQRFKDDQEFFSKNIQDFELELAIAEKFIQQVKDSDVILFQGGIPKQLISVLNSTGDWKKELEGKVLVGISGGADTICKYYGVGKTLNIGEGLGLLPLKIIPHWKSESEYSQGILIDWDSLLEKLKSYREDFEFITLKEGEFITITK